MRDDRSHELYFPSAFPKGASGRGVMSAGADPSAHWMAPNMKFLIPGSSQVASNSPQPMLKTRPLPYCRAKATGMSPSACC